MDTQKKFTADTTYSRGDLIGKIPVDRISKMATKYTVQLNQDCHLHIKEPYCYLNHSCDPNAYLDVDNLRLDAVKHIEAGESVTFFYPGTEWEMFEPFECLCGSTNCLKLVKGSKYSTNYDFKCSSWVKSKIRENELNIL